jgi:hypothetical protein
LQKIPFNLTLHGALERTEINLKYEIRGSLFFSLKSGVQTIFLHILAFCLLPEVSQAFQPLVSDSVIISGIRLRVTNLNRQDEAFLDLTPGHDTVAVSKLDNPGITLALGTAFNRYSIAGRATVEEAGIVPLDLRRPGFLNTMTILKTGPETGFFAIYLKDDAEGTITYLSSDSSTFEFAATGSDQSRFSLLIQYSATQSSRKWISSGYSCPPALADEIPLSGFVSGEKINIVNFQGKSCLSIMPSGKSTLSIASLPSGTYLMPSPDRRKTCLIIRN